MSDSLPPRALAKGVFAALLTPRRQASIEADTAILFDYLDLVSSAGVDGLVLFGATGEFVHFELEERTKVAGLAIKRSRLPVLVNVSHSALYGAVALAESALEAGAAGLLLMPPYFYTYNQDQIGAFYEKFRRQVEGDIPIYLYHLPSCTNPISPGLAERLLESGQFAGIKDSSADRGNLKSLQLLRQRKPFQLLLGNEPLYLEGLATGTVDGTISGVAAALPELLVVAARAVAEQDQGKAELLRRRVDEFVRQFQHFSPFVAIRQAAIARGWPLENSAIPFDQGTTAEVASFQAWFREWWPQVLAECQAAPLVRT